MQHFRPKRWCFHPPQLEKSKIFAQELSIHPLTAQILLNRGIQELSEANTFLRPSLEQLADPFLMKDMQKAVERLQKAIQSQESIVLYGDYDVDGTTGTSLLYLFLKELGAKVSAYIPHRLKEGYGLNIKALEELKSQGANLVVTIDNGISSVEEAKRARDLQIDLVIIDHHQVPPDIPFALAIINPKQKGCEYPYKELAAVGLSFFFALALRKHLREQGFFEGRSEPVLKQHLDLVSLGTIADLVPLTGQNRILVKEGLKVLSQSNKVGIQALKQVAGISGEVGPGQVGFRLGPRINAAGRLHSAKLGFDLLTTSNVEQAQDLAKKLDQANTERQQIEQEILEEASKRVEKEEVTGQHRSIILFEPHWHIGVLGIVASRLVERYYLPTLLGVEEGGQVRCSGRSISGFNLFEGLQKSSAYLQKFGGHKQAAGLHFQAQDYQNFWKTFDAEVSHQLKAEDFTPPLWVDGELDLENFEEAWMQEFESLEPFGMANPSPSFFSKALWLSGQRCVGEKHLKCSFKTGKRFWDAIGFGMADSSVLLESQYLQGVFSCEWNEWNGKRSIQLKLLDLPRPIS